MTRTDGRIGEPLSADLDELLSLQETRRMLDELRKNQTELEKQNDELRTRLQDLESIKSQYFEQAPVGYCTLSIEGSILEINLTAAAMLGTSLKTLIYKPISTHIFPQDLDFYSRQHKILMETRQAQTYEIRLQDEQGNPFWTRIEASLAKNRNGEPLCHLVLVDISEQKRLEISQREAEARFRVLSDDMPGCICTFLPDSTITSCNQAMADLTGMRAEEMIGLKFFDLLEPKDYKFVINQVESLTPENPAEIHEQLHKIPNGARRFIEWRNRAFFNDNGKAYRFLGVGIDITERKKAEAELRASEARFRILLDNLPAISVQGYGPDGTTQYWNQASERVYGYRAKEAIGRNLLELIIPPEMQEGVKEAIRQMAESGQPIPASELSLMRADGSRVPVFSSHAIVQRPGHPQELFCMDIDLTELKKAEDALRRSEENFRAVFNSTNEAIFIDDAETGQMIDVNDSMLKIYGFDSKEEVLAGNIGDLSANVPPYTDERAQEMIRKAIQEGPQVFEWLAKKKDGTNFWIEISLCKSQIGGKGRILAVGRDISDRKQAETKINEQITELRRWHNITMGREERILELKQEVNRLLAEAGLPARYASRGERQSE